MKLAALPFAHWNADVIRAGHLLRVGFESLIIAEYKPEVKESSVFSLKQELETLTDTGHVQACLHGEICFFVSLRWLLHLCGPNIFPFLCFRAGLWTQWLKTCALLLFILGLALLQNNFRCQEHRFWINQAAKTVSTVYTVGLENVHLYICGQVNLPFYISHSKQEGLCLLYKGLTYSYKTKHMLTSIKIYHK